jgi:hypothetical protein
MSLWLWLKTSRGAQLALLAASLGLVSIMVDRCAKRTMTVATEAGKQAQRADSLQETIRQTERANNAAETIRRDVAARRVDCLRDSRTPENC